MDVLYVGFKNLPNYKRNKPILKNLFRLEVPLMQRDFFCNCCSVVQRLNEIAHQVANEFACAFIFCAIA
jgi:hypothetical protein